MEVQKWKDYSLISFRPFEDQRLTRSVQDFLIKGYEKFGYRGFSVNIDDSFQDHSFYWTILKADARIAATIRLTHRQPESPLPIELALREGGGHYSFSGRGNIMEITKRRIESFWRDRRESQRHATSLHAEMLLKGKRVACTIESLGTHGARISLPLLESPVQKHSTVLLFLTTDQGLIEREARVLKVFRKEKDDQMQRRMSLHAVFFIPLSQPECDGIRYRSTVP